MGAVGQARSITAATAIVASIVIARRIDTVGISRLLVLGAALGVLGCGAVSAAPTLAAFLLAHVVIGTALAMLLSGGFAGVAAFAGTGERGQSATSRERTRWPGSSSRRWSESSPSWPPGG